ncbi:hypothetical protein [Nitriliruptor alkaliphilus]|uniref:hypothetical protein n=1 Tax=Nitriliruptor alkaliphilus TaxID=427918 RepID=UPI000697DA47|nr:hypothetical protein [Nitriliruptor alkaliphilus]
MTPYQRPDRRTSGNAMVTGVIALPFVLFVAGSVAVWVGWAANGRNPVTAVFAAGPLVIAGVTFAVSALRGSAPRDRLAPALVAACGATALIWGAFLLALVA